MIVKRTFGDLRLRLLLALAHTQKTINALAKDAGINWKTVDNHLVFLVGKGFVTEVFNSPYVRIFEITQKGKQYLQEKHPKKAPVFFRKNKSTEHKNIENKNVRGEQ